MDQGQQGSQLALRARSDPHAAAGEAAGMLKESDNEYLQQAGILMDQGQQGSQLALGARSDPHGAVGEAAGMLSGSRNKNVAALGGAAAAAISLHSALRAPPPAIPARARARARSAKKTASSKKSASSTKKSSASAKKGAPAKKSGAREGPDPTETGGIFADNSTLAAAEEDDF